MRGGLTPNEVVTFARDLGMPHRPAAPPSTAPAPAMSGAVAATTVATPTGCTSTRAGCGRSPAADGSPPRMSTPCSPARYAAAATGPRRASYCCSRPGCRRAGTPPPRGRPRDLPGPEDREDREDREDHRPTPSLPPRRAPRLGSGTAPATPTSSGPDALRHLGRSHRLGNGKLATLQLRGRGPRRRTSQSQPARKTRTDFLPSPRPAR